MVNLKRSCLALAAIFFAQLFFFSSSAHALSLKSCDYAYTDSTYGKISQSCDGGLLQDGDFTASSKSSKATTYSLTIPVAGNSVATKCTASITVDNGTRKSGKLSGSTPLGNFCDPVLSESIVIDLAQSNASIRKDAANKVLHDKLDSLISQSCSGLQSADAIDSCNTRGKTAIDNCGPAALNAANQAAAVGGAGTDPSAVYTANLIPCLNNATGISNSQLANILGGDIYNEVSKASNSAKVVDDCVIDPETGKCEATEEEDKTTCAIDGIGWIICPAMNFMAGLNDKAYGFLSDYFLQIKVEFLTDKATLSAWTSFRDIANVLFVIAFLVIIYSQITGAGVTNYGIKKMLPRIIIAAILVNISYYLCQIAVDISNIIGASIVSFFDGVPVAGGGDAPGTIGGGWEAAATAVLAVAATVALVLLVILAPSVLLVLAVIVMILIARQAFVILLIVISPIAFVAYLLPNTEQWFKKWWKALSTLLLLFPIIGLVFGASSLASDILFRVAGEDEQMLALVALGVQALPLFAVPVLLKGALSAAGSVGQRLSGYADKAQGRGVKGIKGGRLGEAKTAFDARRQGRGLARRRGGGRLATWGGNEARKDTRLGKTAAFLGTRQKAFDESSAGQYLGGNRGAAAATAGLFKEYDDEVGRQKTLASGRTNEDLLNDLRTGKGSEEYQAAIAGTIMSRQHRDSHLEAVDIVMKRNQAAEESKDTKAMETVSGIQKQMYSDMKDKPFSVGDQAAGQMENGALGKKNTDSEGVDRQFTDINAELASRVQTKLSAATLVNMNPDELKRMHQMATNRNVSDDDLNSLYKEGKIKTTTRLTDDQLTQFKAAINEIPGSRYSNDVKPEAQKIHDDVSRL